MNPFKSYTLTWWQFSLLKTAIIAFGLALGASWPAARRESQSPATNGVAHRSELCKSLFPAADDWPRYRRFRRHRYERNDPRHEAWSNLRGPPGCWQPE